VKENLTLKNIKWGFHCGQFCLSWHNDQTPLQPLEHAWPCAIQFYFIYVSKLVIPDNLITVKVKKINIKQSKSVFYLATLVHLVIFKMFFYILYILSSQFSYAYDFHLMENDRSATDMLPYSINYSNVNLFICMHVFNVK
jgi:hypothetical protein